MAAAAVPRALRAAGMLFLAAILGQALGLAAPALPYRILSGVAVGFLVVRWRMWRGEPGIVPEFRVRLLGMMLVGLGIGFSVAVAEMVQARGTLPLFLALAFAAVIGGGVIGWIYARQTGLDLFTALIATMPGGLATMSALAMERGRGVTVVSVVQTMRLTVAILLVSILATTASAKALPTLTGTTGGRLVWAALALLAAWLGLRLFQRWRVPMAALFSAILAGLLVQAVAGPLLASLAGPPQLPPLMLAVGQLLLGIGVGETIAVQPALNRTATLYGMVTVVATIMIGLLAAVVAHELDCGDWLTCLLMTVPGGAPEIMTFALTLPVKIESVTLAQVIRQLVISLLLPVWVLLFNWLDRRFAGIKSAENLKSQTLEAELP